MSFDELKNQEQAFAFLRERFRTDEPFTRSDLRRETKWTERSLSTYWSKQFEPFVVPVPPLLRGRARQSQKYRVTDVFLTVSNWDAFRRHVSQKRRITFSYDEVVYDTVLMFDFFLPLTNETVLRNALDSLFYRDTVRKKLLAIGFSELRKQLPGLESETDGDYIGRAMSWLARSFGGYSITHVNGRFRSGHELLDFQSAANLLERGGRYLIDETTAITRFIFPCANRAEAERVSWFFHRLFVDSVIRVAGEAEVWMIESGVGHPRLHVWTAHREES